MVADPALKHRSRRASSRCSTRDIEIGAIVMAPAGTIGGFHGFLGQIVTQAAEAGLRAVVITDRAVPDAALGKVRLDGGRWLFELDETTTTTRTAPPRPAAGARAAADSKARAPLGVDGYPPVTFDRTTSSPLGEGTWPVP